MLKRYFLLICSILLLLPQLVACKSEKVEVIKKNDSITKVAIFLSADDIGKKSSEIPILVIEDENGTKLFLNLIDNAIKMEGILNIVAPKYIGEISYPDRTETIYFNIDNTDEKYSGIFINKIQTETGYEFKEKDMKEFMIKYGGSLKEK